MIADFFVRYLRIAEALAGLAIVAGIAWGVHSFLEHERDIGRQEVQARWDAQRLIDEQASKKQAEFWQSRVNDALIQGAKNVQALHADAAVAQRANDSLRDTNTALSKLLSNASPEAARAYASAYQAVFADCVGRYQAMGQAAQGHANDSATLNAAFPTQGEKR